ncbi:MAG: NAD+ synthase [Nitrospirota bacterium]|nr:NAD+ synthase [Nitrospirota bacterium]
MAQINSTVGDFSGNFKKIAGAIEAAKKAEVDLIAFPEMAITGYPPEDLLLKPAFVLDNLKVLHDLIPLAQGLTIVLGFVDRPESDDASQKEVKYNAAAVIHEGRLEGVYHKICLPNYGVFDENRYFKAGKSVPVFTRDGLKIAVNICEDIWHKDGPTALQALSGGAQLIVNINASPYQMGKGAAREEILSQRAEENAVCIAYVNMVGGQDELVFDGGSLVMDARGNLLARAPRFTEDLSIIDLSDEVLSQARKIRLKPAAIDALPLKKWVFLDLQKRKTRKAATFSIAKNESSDTEVYKALVLGLSDYMGKNRFKKGVIAISGGIDSALTAAIAVDALGAENIVGVFMPSRYTSPESVEDAEALAENLGIRLMTYSIEDPFTSFLDLLSTTFKGQEVDTTEENLQARIRGNIMMALSNKFSWLVLTTGNKSEMSVGYATLYGDMAGGFAVIKDLWKTAVYRLSEMRNDKKEVIPRRTIDRPPTAELRPDQCDQDSLPPYEVLDAILQAYVEAHQHREEIVAMGFELETVSKVLKLVDSSEFKRRQAPVGIKITSRALGKDRRMPITNRYRRFYQQEEQESNYKPKREKIA